MNLLFSTRCRIENFVDDPSKYAQNNPAKVTTAATQAPLQHGGISNIVYVIPTYSQHAEAETLKITRTNFFAKLAAKTRKHSQRKTENSTRWRSIGR